MRDHRYARLVLVWVALYLCGNAQQRHLAEYQARVEFGSPAAASVSVSVRTSAAGGSGRLLLAPQADQTIEGITVTDEGGRPVAAEARWEDGVVRIEGIVPEAFSVRYRVTASRTLHRIPLPAPSVAALPQQRPVSIAVVLPRGHVAVANSFPGLQWRDAEHGSAQLAAVPSVIVLRVAPREAVTPADRLLTPETLSTTAMLALLLLGSIFWIARNRRRAG
ncbi:MAG TPA: hypothetical protein VFA60_11940 [Terriglobales bacterium]|nr:hypothetical protein [Terriglobales bacterium]